MNTLPVTVQFEAFYLAREAQIKDRLAALGVDCLVRKDYADVMNVAKFEAGMTLDRLANISITDLEYIVRVGGIASWDGNYDVLMFRHSVWLRFALTREGNRYVLNNLSTKERSEFKSMHAVRQYIRSW